MMLNKIHKKTGINISIRIISFSIASMVVMTICGAALVNGDTLAASKVTAPEDSLINISKIKTSFPIITPTIIIEASVPKPEENIADESIEEVIIDEVVEEPVAEEPAWTEEACSVVMYLTANCNVRTEPNANAELIQILSSGTQVTVVAKTNMEFYKIENGGFISSKYLSETAPVASAASSGSAGTATGTTGYAQLDELISGIFSKIFTSGMSDAEKIRACYVYLINNTTYQRGMSMPSGFGDTSVEGSNSYVASAAYGCLTTGKGSCNRYSAAFVAMMRMLGYEAHYISGLTSYSNGTMGGHAWTEVVIGGTAYIFDPQVEDNMIDSGVSDGYARYWKTYAELGSKYIKQ